MCELTPDPCSEVGTFRVRGTDVTHRETGAAARRRSWPTDGPMEALGVDCRQTPGPLRFVYSLMSAPTATPNANAPTTMSAIAPGANVS